MIEQTFRLLNQGMTHKDLSFPHSSMTLINAFATESHLIVIMGCWAVIKRGLNVAAHYFPLAKHAHTYVSRASHTNKVRFRGRSGTGL